MADKIFNAEVTRFALRAQKDCLEEILDLWGIDIVDRGTIEAKLEEINKQLNSNLDKKSKSSKPRKLSAYNMFVREKLPELKKSFPDLKNKELMSKVSDLWKETSPEDKTKYTPVGIPSYGIMEQ